MAGNDEKKRKVSAMLAVAAVGGSGGGKKSCKAGDGTDAAGEAPPRRSGRQRKQPPLVAEDEALRAAAGKKSCSSEGEDYDDDDSIEDYDEEESKGGHKRKGKLQYGERKSKLNKAHAEIKKAGDLYTWINKKEAERQEYKREKNPYKKEVQKGWEYLDPSACLALKTLGEDERSKLIDNLNGNQKKVMSYALGLRSVESIDCNLAENLKKFFAGDESVILGGQRNSEKNSFQNGRKLNWLQSLFMVPILPDEISTKVSIQKYKIIIEKTEGGEGDSNLLRLCIALGIPPKDMSIMMRDFVKANFLIGPENHPYLKSERVYPTEYERERLELIHPDITGPGYKPPSKFAASMRDFLSNPTMSDSDKVDSISDRSVEVKAKRKKRKKNKDPNRPKRNMSAFFLYSNAHRERVKGENPDAKFGDIAKLLSAEFKELPEDDKAEWNEKADADKQRYLHEMENYVPPSDNSDSDNK